MPGKTLLLGNFMKESYGLVGKTLKIDLGSRSATTLECDHKWLGGKAFASNFLFNHEPVGVEEFSPDRWIIISTGLLTGTLAPSSARGVIANRNLITGGISTSNFGGFFPALLKFAGFDHIVITGKAAAPTYLFIQDGKVEFKNASALWGKDSWETDEILRDGYPDSKVSVLCIGQAGENLSRAACIISERDRAASWGGNGAVMGAKLLKAIAVTGSGSVRIANPIEFKQNAGRAAKQVGMAHGNILLRRGGTLGLIGTLFNPYVYKYYQNDTWIEERASEVSYKSFRKNHGAKPTGCFNCPISCGRHHHVKKGKYKGLTLDGGHINSVRAMGSQLDIADTSSILALNAVANRYGYNVDFISGIVAWVLECLSRDILNVEDIGYHVEWGSVDSILKLIDDITFRRGIGEILAEGVHRASLKFGDDSRKVAILNKGLEINEGRLRSNKGWALGVLLSPRGGGHLDGAPAMEGVGYDEKLVERVYGVENVNDAGSYEHKAKFVLNTQLERMLVDSMGVCAMTGIWHGPDLLTSEDFSVLYRDATGDSKSKDELLFLCLRAVNVQKAFNSLHGRFTREDDYPPERLMSEEVPSGPMAGAVLHRDGWDKMLNDFYAINGWDEKTGRQTRQGLLDLGLDEVAKKLQAHNLLID